MQRFLVTPLTAMPVSIPGGATAIEVAGLTAEAFVVEAENIEEAVDSVKILGLVERIGKLVDNGMSDEAAAELLRQNLSAAYPQLVQNTGA